MGFEVGTLVGIADGTTEGNIDGAIEGDLVIHVGSLKTGISLTFATTTSILTQVSARQLPEPGPNTSLTRLVK